MINVSYNLTDTDQSQMLMLLYLSGGRPETPKGVVWDRQTAYCINEKGGYSALACTFSLILETKIVPSPCRFLMTSALTSDNQALHASHTYTHQTHDRWFLLWEFGAHTYSGSPRWEEWASVKQRRLCDLFWRILFAATLLEFRSV